ncbi:MAG: four helix bundle protein [Phycisphaerae bacterium]|nr:four helix bundle protein [Phycisphaerae bacterium]
MTELVSFNFERLSVYQKALDVIDKVYEYTNAFPKEEMFGLTSQFRRSAVSISLNIAEGSARSKKDFRRFLDIAHGSVFECVATVEICRRRQYIKESIVLQLREAFTEISKMISGLKKSIGFSDRCES